eukprot:comp23800_c0_seq1/m.41372 comp23800_c0_seq1/g.41372  ORF comp23800_c0_seq1/g.41372 comp23800_c0_seq1/m.41372 type:complete len:2646 (-) comp23800_c0_seq1:58-7995(-)
MVRWRTRLPCRLAGVVALSIFGCALALDCAVKDEATGAIYDLSVLTKRTGGWTAGNSRDATGHDYKLNICGGLSDVGTCDATGAGCEMGSFDGVNKTINLGLPAGPKLQSGGGLVVEYLGGSVCAGDTKASTLIKLSCGETLGAPVFLQRTATCQYQFEWTTSAACAKGTRLRGCSAYDAELERQYDLTPLIRETDNWLAVTSGQSNTSYIFYLNVCRDLTSNGEGSHCAKNGNSMCRGEKNKSELVSIAKAESTRIVAINGTLSLVYEGGQKCATNEQSNHSALVQMLCKPGELGVPKYITDTPTCQSQFLWETFVACPNSGSELGSACRVADPITDTIYDLTGLVNDTDYSVTFKDSVYHLQICNPLRNLRTCGVVGAAACMTSTTDPNVAISLGQSSAGLRRSDGLLSLDYTGGAPCPSDPKRTRNTTIIFKCSKDLRVPNFGSGPKYIEDADLCNELFEWETPLACGKSRETLECTVRDDSTGHVFNLSPLRALDFNWAATDTREGKGMKYFINVCGTLTDPESSGCPTNAAVCGVGWEVGSKGVTWGGIAKPLAKEGKVMIKYDSGETCEGGKGNRTTTINFVCEPGKKGRPVLLASSTDCELQFEWRTYVACVGEGETIGSNCTVTDPVTMATYDLTSLAKPDGYTLSTNETHSYVINICNPVKNSGCGGENVGGCQKDTGHNTGLAHGNLTIREGVLYLVYKEGDFCHHANSPRSTIITFTCGPDLGTPKFVRENEDCSYVITWATSLACSSVAGEIPCTAMDPTGRIVDVGGLGLEEENYVVYDGSEGNHTYRINVCRPLVNPPIGCGVGSSACLSVYGAAGVETTHTLGQSNKAVVEYKNGALALTYTGGEKCALNPAYNRSVLIMFTCKPFARGSPKFIGRSGECQYQFEWATARACAQADVVAGNDCKVTDPATGAIYDLSSLSSLGTLRSQSKIDQGLEFRICAPMEEGKSVCAGRVGACDIDTKRNMGQPNNTLVLSGGALTLTYDNGDKCGESKHYRTVVSLTCGVKEEAEVTLLRQGEHSCTAMIDVSTSLACGNEKKETECSARDMDGTVYDLSELAEVGFDWRALDSRENSAFHYKIGVCRPLLMTPTPCTKGVGVCQVDSTSNGTTGHNAGFGKGGPTAKNGAISLLYEGGDSCHDGKFNRSVLLTFTCLQDTVGTPVFVSETPECQYQFEWATDAACVVKPATGSDCMVKDPNTGVTYDLSLLKREGKDYRVTVNGAERYALNVCGVSPGCRGESTSICDLSVPNGDHSLGTINNTLYLDDGVITLTYLDGKECAYSDGQKSKFATKIVFACDTTAGKGEPKFVSEDACSAVFHWSTDVLCPTRQSVNCVANDKITGKQYDLTTLINSGGNYMVSGAGSDGESVEFHINVCQGLNTLVGDWEGTDCWRHASICQRRGKLLADLGHVTTGPQAHNGTLTLLYEGGQPCHVPNHNTSTLITFICKEGEKGYPHYVGETATCQHQFEWETAAACEAKVTEGSTGTCQVRDPSTGTLFDLSSLSHPDGYTLNGADNHTYVVNVCGNLDRANAGCPTGVGACQSDTKKSMGTENSTLTYADGIVTLIYSGGDICHHTNTSRYTVIVFVCGEGVGQIRFVEEKTDCSYLFEWKTSLACTSVRQSSDCTVVDEVTGAEYDLSPLSRSDGPGWEAEGVPSGQSLHINICKPLPTQPLGCPPGAAACMVDTKNPTQTHLLGVAHSSPTVKNGALSLLYEGGSPCSDGKTNHSLLITFACDKDKHMLGVPVVAQSQDGCQAHVTWTSSAACPVTTHMEGSECTLTDKSTGSFYDLRPLNKLSNGQGFIISDMTTYGQTYSLNVCGEVGGKFACGAGAGACMIDTEGKIVKIGAANSSVELDNGSLRLLLAGEEPCPKSPTVNRTTQILFVCSKRVGSGNPRLVLNDEDCSYTFQWPTAIACASKDEEVPCAFSSTFTGKKYDLSSLARSEKGDQNWVVEDTKNNKRFLLNVCRGLMPNLQERTDGGQACPTNIGACAYTPNNPSSATSLGHVTSSPKIDSEGLVTFTYSLGAPCAGGNQSASATINLKCDKGAGLGTPEFTTTDGCAYYFDWKTSAACPISESPDTTEACKLTDPISGNVYNLNQLTADRNDYSAKANGYTYYVNVCKQLNDLRGCPDGSTVCRVKEDGRTQDGMGMVAHQSLMYMAGQTVMNLQGEDCKQGGSYSSSIQFTCDPNGLGRPVVSYDQNCSVVFNWRTSAVCDPHKETEVSCRIKHPTTNKLYNLTPLSRTTPLYRAAGQTDDGWEVKAGQDTYVLGVCRSVPGSVCGSTDVGVCAKTNDKTTAIGHASTQFLSFSADGKLVLNYKGIDSCADDPTKPTTVQIQLLCTPDGTTQAPTHAAQEKCAYYFAWRTSAACEIAESLGKDCKVTTSSGSVFDLSKLKRTDSDWTVSGRDQGGVHYTYLLNVCGGVSGVKGGYGVATTDGANMGMPTDVVTEFDGKLSVLYENGAPCPFNNSLKTSSEILFSCEPSGDIGSPRLLGKFETGCRYLFEWQTSEACPLASGTPQQGGSSSGGGVIVPPVDVGGDDGGGMGAVGWMFVLTLAGIGGALWWLEKTGRISPTWLRRVFDRMIMDPIRRWRLRQQHTPLHQESDFELEVETRNMINNDDEDEDDTLLDL